MSGRGDKSTTTGRYVPYNTLLSIDPMTLYDGRGPHLHLLVNPIEPVM